MVQRNRRHHDLATRDKVVRRDRLELHDVRDQVAVRERRALGQAGGSTRVLQEDQVVAGHCHTLQRQVRALRQRRFESDCAVDTALPGCADENDLPDRRARHHLRHRGRTATEHDDGLCPGITELMPQFARRIERVDVDLDRAYPRDRDQSDRECDQVRQHHGNAVALAHP